MTRQFQIGRTYSTRSICDHDTVYSFTILSRTAKQVTVEVHGKIVKRGLSIVDGVEQFKPFGSYSMCAIIRAGERYTTDAAIDRFDADLAGETIH